MADPTVSVIMPVYNAARYLPEAVESVLGQTFSDFEFLIVDDGSTDDSGAILDDYAAADPRVRVTHRANGGYTSALNLMLAEARGEFAARLDADDRCRPDRFAEQLDYLRRHPNCGVVGSYYGVIDEDGDLLARVGKVPVDHESITAVLVGDVPGPFLCHSAAMIRRRAVREVDGYRVELEPSEDMDLWQRISEAGWRLRNLPRPLVDYRVHVGSVSALRAREQSETHVAVLRGTRARRNLCWPPEAPLPSPQTRTATEREQRVRHVSTACRSGCYATARKHVVRLRADGLGGIRWWRLWLQARTGPLGNVCRAPIELRRTVKRRLRDRNRRRRAAADPAPLNIASPTEASPTEAEAGRTEAGAVR